MALLKSYKKEILWLVLLGVIYFVLRLHQLGVLPIFTDEAIYLHWAVVAKADAAQRFISLTDGKQPMLIWLTVVLLYFINDPLIAGRLVSVFAGFFTMVGLYLLGKELFQNKWVGIISAALYVFYPMALVYDRMALYDSLVGTFAVWSLYFEVLLVRRVQLDKSLLLALILGAGELTKSSAFFSVALLPFSLTLFNWRVNDRVLRLLKWVFYACIAFGLAYLYYSVLRLSPFFYIIDQKNTEFVFPLIEWTAHPFLYFTGNIQSLLLWLSQYMTISYVLLLFVGLIFGKRFLKEYFLLIIWFIAPFIYLALFAKIIYPRYILFMTLSLLPIIAYSIVSLQQKIHKRLIFGILLILLSIWPLYTDYKILTDFVKAPIPKGDLDQFITGWAAGGGVKEAVIFFQQVAKDKKIYIGTQGTFGLMPYALEIYLAKNPNITILGYWPIDNTPPADLQSMSKYVPTYVLFYQPCPSCARAGDAPLSWPLKEVLRIQKSNETSLAVYRLMPK